MQMTLNEQLCNLLYMLLMIAMARFQNRNDPLNSLNFSKTLGFWYCICTVYGLFGLDKSVLKKVVGFYKKLDKWNCSLILLQFQLT